MTKDRKPEALLDDLLSQAREDRARPSSALTNQVFADALEHQPATPPKQVRRAGVLAALGGWPVLGSMTVAGCVGLWIGISPPTGMTEIAAYYLGADIVAEFSTGFDRLDEFAAEG